ncbi:MAG: ABC transporter ATP-binding protein [Bacteroidota bacterium]
MKWSEMTDQLPDFTHVFEQIMIQDFSYYHPVREPLQGVSFRFKAGQITCLIGGYKSGKSTIVNLLDRSYLYLKGSICIDGKELKALDKKKWLSQIAVVPQYPDFPYKTIADNIAAKECSGEEETNVIAFCKIYGFHRYITQFKKGYKTVIGNLPSPLTLPQRQLIALARALYPCPGVLILNDSTTAMDFRMERHALDILHRIKEHMIILLITGRPKVAYRSNYVYILEGGRVIKQGDPDAITQTLERLI